jgi:uncharacterized membrane protein YgdD (TMEM256/DUF423 family)
MMRLAAVLGALAVAAGAFGAHGLKDHVTAERLATWHTASTYHLVHAVVLLALALAPTPRRLSAGLFTAGIFLFSGSLYALVLLDQPMLGAITPLGGLAFIAGWLNLARSAPRSA